MSDSYDEMQHLISTLERIADTLEEGPKKQSALERDLQRTAGFCGQTQPHPAHEWWSSGPEPIPFKRNCWGHS